MRAEPTKNTNKINEPSGEMVTVLDTPTMKPFDLNDALERHRLSLGSYLLSAKCGAQIELMALPDQHAMCAVWYDRDRERQQHVIRIDPRMYCGLNRDDVKELQVKVKILGAAQ